MDSIKNRLVLNILTLHALVVAKPLFDIFESNPQYFVINRIPRFDVILFIGFLSIGLPLLIVIPIAVVQKVNVKSGVVAQTVVVGAYGFGYVLQLASRLDVLLPVVCIAAGFFAAVGIAILYWRNEQFSLVISLVSPIVLVFPLLFALSGNMDQVLFKRSVHSIKDAVAGAKSIENPHPIVLLVLDEFPLTDMLDANGNIHADRFPNFANLAAESTWYENASTLWPQTVGSLPTILTGIRPSSGTVIRLPSLNSYPENLFSMVQNEYSLNVTEPLTDFLPVRFKNNRGKTNVSSGYRPLRILIDDAYVLYLHIVLPNKLTKDLPRIDQGWGNFRSTVQDGEGRIFNNENVETKKLDGQKPGLEQRIHASRRLDRIAQFNSFLRSIETFPKTTLHFFHTIFPHAPFEFLPSGKIYTDLLKDTGIEEEKPVWQGSDGSVQRLHHSLRLQEALADRLLGDLVAELKRIGIYDESLVIVTSDHGGSFIENQPYRRPTEFTFADIAFIPLFIKYPDQKDGERNESNVALIDIVPTIKDVIGADVNWTFDGQSLAGGEFEPRKTKVLPDYRGGTIEMSPHEYIEAKKAAIKRKIERFNLDDPRADFFRYGNGLEYIGEAETALASKLVDGSIQCDGIAALRDVDLNLRSIPCRLIGTVTANAGDPSKLHVAFVVNGKIELISRLMKVDGQVVFDAVLPDTSFKQGANTVKALLIDLE
jgi:hypothetical protein